MKIKYVTIIVADMDESVKFYTEVLGFEIDSIHNPYPGLTIKLLKGEGDAMLELIENIEILKKLAFFRWEWKLRI